MIYLHLLLAGIATLAAQQLAGASGALSGAASNSYGCSSEARVLARCAMRAPNGLDHETTRQRTDWQASVPSTAGWAGSYATLIPAQTLTHLLKYVRSVEGHATRRYATDIVGRHPRSESVCSGCPALGVECRSEASKRASDTGMELWNTEHD